MTTRLLSALLLLAVLVPLIGSPAQAAPATTRAKPTTIVSLTFDDGDTSHVLAGRLLRKHRMVGTFYINSGKLGKKGVLTPAQVKWLAKQGNEIGGHTLHHARLTDLTPAKARTQICQDRAALLKLGYRVRTLAYPYGAQSPSIEKIAKFCGYNAARTVGGLAESGCIDCGPVAETIPPRDPYLVRTPGSIRENVTIEDVQAEIEAAEADGGGFVPLVIHRVCTSGCGEYSMTPKMLDQLLRWLSARKSEGTVVRRFGDVIGGKTEPMPKQWRARR